MSEKLLSPRKHEKLLRRLHSPDEAIRVHAALQMIGPGVDAGLVRAGLAQALSDSDPHVRRLAAWVLARLAPASRAA